MALPTGSLSIAKAVQCAADVRCYLKRRERERKKKKRGRTRIVLGLDQHGETGGVFGMDESARHVMFIASEMDRS